MLTVEFRYVHGMLTGTWGITDLSTQDFYPFGDEVACKRLVNSHTPTRMRNEFSSIPMAGRTFKDSELPESEPIQEQNTGIIQIKRGRKFKHAFV